jgi:predicted transcriptional regulator
VIFQESGASFTIGDDIVRIIQTNGRATLIYVPLLSRHIGRRGTMKGNSVLTSKIESEIELLQRHVQMLKAIMDNEPIGIIRLSELLVYPQHKVRYSLRILEQEGLIKPSPEGAVTTDKLKVFMEQLKVILDDMERTVKELKAQLE